MSAIGSRIIGESKEITKRVLPARLANAHEFSGVGFFTDADAAHVEFAEVSVRTAANAAAVVETGRELDLEACGLPAVSRGVVTLAFYYEGLACHKRKVR
jgi:hypothetical protein